MGSYLLLWFPMLVLAILNGSAREWYKQFMPESRARQLSTLSLLVLFTLYIWGVVEAFPPRSDREAVYIGLLWLLLTLAFEFGFGRLRGNTWKQLFAEYDLLSGKLWILVPVWVAVAPYVFYRLTL